MDALLREYRSQREPFVVPSGPGGKFALIQRPASEAYYNARINIEFAAAEARGDVEFKVELDPEPFDDSYLDTWPISDSERERVRAALRDQIDREGVWGVVGKARLSCGGLHEVDSVWGFVGEGWDGSGYDTDVKRTALEAIGKTLG